jgi:hypothetical protein
MGEERKRKEVSQEAREYYRCRINKQTRLLFPLSLI